MHQRHEPLTPHLPAQGRLPIGILLLLAQAPPWGFSAGVKGRGDQVWYDSAWAMVPVPGRNPAVESVRAVKPGREEVFACPCPPRGSVRLPVSALGPSWLS